MKIRPFLFLVVKTVGLYNNVYRYTDMMIVSPCKRNEE